MFEVSKKHFISDIPNVCHARTQQAVSRSCVRAVPGMVELDDSCKDTSIVSNCDTASVTENDCLNSDKLLTQHCNSVDNEENVSSLTGENVSGNANECDVCDTSECYVSNAVHTRSGPKFSFLHWNVCGVAAKLYDLEFIQYVTSFDFVCLVETFLDSFTSSVFSDYVVYCKPAVKLTRQGRRSGGVMCLVRKELATHIRELNCDSGNFLCFLLNKNMLQLDRDVVYMCAYVPPENSSYYTVFDIENGISVLEEALTDIMLSLDDVYVLLCGDFNGRTSDIFPDIWENNYNSYEQDEDETISRCSEDTVLNSYGKFLLNMCVVFGLCILNGVCNGDQQGRFTYISDTGNSVNDYFIISKELFYVVQNDSRLSVTDRIESDHMPVEFHVGFEKLVNQKTVKDQTLYIERFEWKEHCAQQFFDALKSDQCKEQIDFATSLIDVDVNRALEIFIDCLKDKAEIMKMRIYVNRPKKQHAWFDKECRDTRQNLRKLLRKFRKSSKPIDSIAFCKARKDYKHLLRDKRKAYNQNLADKLVQCVSDQKLFWQTMHAVPGSRSQQSNNISVEDWFIHFKDVLQKDVHEVENDVLGAADDVDIENSAFNRPISKEEVLLSISKLKNKKAAGPDGVINEMLKHGSGLIVDFLVKYFNALFDKGIYPDNWCKSIIIPLFKKGDQNDPNNYRGISLCDVCGKLYSSIINNRLQEWIEENNITGEYQGGFKKGYSTIDHMFTLLALIQKQFAFNRKLYVAFIDFEKAFDSISRKLLWPILLKNGIRGKLYHCVRSMYDSVKAQIRCGTSLTEYISCTQGVKQGDVCSPVLFSLFVNELALEIISNGRHGANISNEFIELFILLFADDIVLLSETVIGLQTQLNSLHRSAMELQLKVNMNKSNIVVFRKGGFLAAREIWFYGKSEITVVNSYKYLGIYFSTRLSFRYACEDLVSKAKKALLCVMTKLYRINNDSLSVFFKLFDAQIQPIVQYGAEIWGLENASSVIENIHLFAMKRFLGIGTKTPNDLVYGELGRYPIYLNSIICCVRYWLKLVSMEERRLPFKAYRMLYRLDQNGKVNWVSNIRKVLSVNGFAFVWENQGVGCVGSFLREFKQRLIDCRWQHWNSHISSSDRFSFYRRFKTVSGVEPYLLMELNRHVRNALTKFRLGISDIAVHASRYKSCCADDMKCPVCKSPVETEVHFALCCTAFEDLRKKFVPSKFCNFPDVFDLIQLLSTSNESMLKNFAVYLYTAFKRRKTITNV